jgi:DNA cross-link repair 1A protein
MAVAFTEGTANLIIHMLSVDPKWVHPLPMDVPSIIPDTGGVSVTLIEANHCMYTHRDLIE